MISIDDFKTGLRMRGFTYDNQFCMYKSPPDENDNHYWLTVSANNVCIYLYHYPLAGYHKKFNKKMLLWVPERYNTIEAFESELDRMETAYMLEKL